MLINLAWRNNKALRSGLHTFIPGDEYRDRGAIDVKPRTLDNFIEGLGYNDPYA